MSEKILVLYAHPAEQKSRVNRQLKARIMDLPNVVIHDLYEMYPDYHIDVDHEQKALLEATVVILQHPFYWYSCPPILKMWMDDVLELGFAYGPQGEELQGKYWMQALTTGGPVQAYARNGTNHFTMEELLRPFEQTALLCGMKVLQPSVLHSAGRMSNEEIQNASDQYRKLIENLVQGVFPPPHSTLNI